MLNSHKKGLAIVGLASLMLYACTKEKVVVPAATANSAAVDTCITISYATDIAPMVSASCNSASCHKSGSLFGDFTSYAGLKAVANSGSLNNRVVVLKTMPSSGPFTDEQRKKIECWIEQGALNN
mgnify:CR=1 FL=1